MNIQTRFDALTVRAGYRALEKLRSGRLQPSDIHVIPGAAGGPKALGITGLDKAIFGEFLAGDPQPKSLIGSSIGSWRFAAIAASADPAAKVAELAELYTVQRFPKGITPAEITRRSTVFLDQLIGGCEDHILNHPVYRLNILIVRSRGWLEHDHKGRLGLGLMAAISANMVSRKHLGRFMERGIVRDQRLASPVSKLTDFPSHEVPLTRENLLPTLLASASIPMIMNGVRSIPGAPDGVYRDGGLIDYHLDLPFKQPGIVLYPHFTDRVVPGWFDKSMPWRKGDRERLKDVLLISPSADYLETLPDRKLPDRKDFERYMGADQDRETAWRAAVAASDRLGDEFLELVATGNLANRVKPLH